MTQAIYITPQFAVAPQIESGDFQAIMALGFDIVMNNRPDHEDGVIFPSKLATAQAEKAGLDYLYVPAENHDLSDPDLLDRFQAVLSAANGPVFAHCKSGTRTAILWALVSARHQPVDQVLATLTRAGFDFEFLTDELEEQNQMFGEAMLPVAGVSNEIPRAEAA